MRLFATRRTRWGLAAAGILVASAAVTFTIASRIPLSSSALRSRVTAELASRLDSEVELGELTFRLIPSPRVSGRDLVVRADGAALLAILAD